jgi:hypothetical protein
MALLCDAGVQKNEYTFLCRTEITMRIQSVIFFFALSLLYTIAEAGQQYEVTLYGGTVKDPYTLYYPVEITEPGQIEITIQVKKANPAIASDERPISAMLVDLRAFGEKKPMTTPEWKKWLQKANKYNPAEYFAGDEIRHWVSSMKSLVKSALGKKKKRKKVPDYVHRGTYYGYTSRVTIKYAVDAPELSRYQGRYVLVLNNTSRSEVNQTLSIGTPGDPSPQTTADAPREQSDLVVKGMGVNRDGNLTVTVANIGKGEVPVRAWELQGENAVTLMITRNGKSWGGVTLPLLDTKKRLMNPGGQVRYTFNLNPTGSKISATIDASHKIRESNENNNSLTKSF